jgi:DNA-binding winged helix-turn-helix (wHTH) protein
MKPRRARFGPYQLDLVTGELRKHGLRLKLQQQPFQILESLLAVPGELVTREQLRSKLWPDGTFVDYEHGLNAAMQKLRDTLNDSSATPVYIETLPKRGYRFVGEATFEEGGADGGTAEGDKQSGRSAESGEAGATRWLFLLLQVMYLTFYIVTLALFRRIGEGIVDSRWLLAGPMPVVILVTAVVGVALRLFLTAGTLLDYARIGAIVLRIFPAVLALDMMWALAPLLIERHLGTGLALAAVAALVWSPFAQRTLLRMSAGTSHRRHETEAG